MKNSNVGLCAIVVVFGALVATASPLGGGQELLGAKKCTWGPAYWCGNLTNAKGCNAVRHCIQTVWETQEVPVDDDSICKICKDMVTQARDQLRSNETMEELKEVFEGSCNLIPIKVVKKECCKLADDFIPELVEALSSQMNPDQVCSVAGLCNNAEIDRLLMSYYSGALDGTLKEDPITDAPSKPSQELAATPTVRRQLSCGNCNNIATFLSEKFHSTNRDDILENLLHLCGEMSSFSDACSNIVLTYFNDIYDHMKQNLAASGICHMSGVCSGKYHQHPEDPVEEVEEEIVDLGAISAEVDGGNDIPCELCQQLVHHLRDLLVANTTEEEFKQVLEGLCKQTQGFKAECLSIVDQYYDVIYHSLVNNLDANGACFIMGVCPKTSSKQSNILDSGIMPLLPAFPPAEIKVTIRKKLGANEPKFSQEEIMSMQLPIDHLMGAANPELLVEGGELCVLCEYLLHFMQETLATPATEDQIKAEMKKICQKMPKTMSGQCSNFVEIYGDAMVSLMVQELDPRQICPMMKLCPANNPKREDMEVFAPESVNESSDKPTCPLCLFAVEQAQQKIKNDKSKKNIRDVLDHLCVHLPNKLQAECVDFVETYSNELIDMLITDFKPQEICTALRLCPKTNTYLSDLGISMEEEDDASNSDESFNEIEDSNEMPVQIVFDQDNSASPNCWLCEEVIKTAEKKVGKNKSRAEIKNALEHSCDKLRKNMQKQCHKYVDKYGDKIASLIIKEMAPKMICRELGLCLWSEQEDLEIDEALKYDVIAMPNEKYNIEGLSERLTGVSSETLMEPPTCVLCEFVMTKMESELKNKTTEDEIKHVIETICNKMPKTVAKSCDKFVEQYANAIIALIGSVPPKEVCQKLQLCFAGLDSVVNDEVIECGVCHGVSIALLPFFRQHRDYSVIDQHDMVSVGCEDLPAKYYEICSEMIQTYGPSILHLSQKDYVDEAHVCAEIGKCFDNESSGSAFARISA